jgi:hypothetical protein
MAAMVFSPSASKMLRFPNFVLKVESDAQSDYHYWHAKFSLVYTQLSPRESQSVTFFHFFMTPKTDKKGPGGTE